MLRRVYALAALGAAAFGIVLVGQADRSALAQAAPVDVVMDEYVFGPAMVDIPAGVVTFNLYNQDARLHDMVIGYGGVEMPSPRLQTGEAVAWEVTLDQPGTYEFWCSVTNHRERGMVGTLTVQ